MAVLRGYSWVLRQSALQPARGIPPPGFGVRILRRWQPRYLKHQRATAGRSIHSEHRAIYSEHRAIYSIRGRPPAALFIAIIAHRGRSTLEQREPSVFLLVQPVQPEEVPAAQTQTNQLFPLGAVPTRPFPLSLVPTQLLFPLSRCSRKKYLQRKRTPTAERGLGSDMAQSQSRGYPAMRGYPAL